MSAVAGLAGWLPVAALVGAGVGLGLCAIVASLVPRRPPLAAALAHLTNPTPATSSSAADGWAVRVTQPAARLLAAAGLPRPRTRRDLTVLDRPVHRHLTEQAVLALAGLLAPPAVAALLAAGGIWLGWLTPAWVSLMLATTGVLAADARVRAAASRRRDQLRHTLSCYLDLVVICLAGGSGVDGALSDAATITRGWAADQLRGALDTAHLTRTTPWAALGRLGHDLHVPELVELAAAVSLAGTEGAKVRASLAAKAAALRAHELADAETRAAAATERMALPVMVLFAGFLLFIAYPAVAAVLGDL